MSGKLRLLRLKCLAQRMSQCAALRQRNAASRPTRLKKAFQPWVMAETLWEFRRIWQSRS
jgi:hypothetical protein